MKNQSPKSVDSILLILIGILVISGFFIFSSASLGLLARDGASFSSVAFGQLFFGIIGGGLAMLITSHIYYRNWRQYAFYIFLGTLLLTLAVFIPGLGYQIQQSLIAIGTGGVFGQGYGQSIQKFEYLPEPIGDSIFAVYAEEFGFLGSLILIMVLAFFTFRGFKIATEATDLFGMLLVVGFMTLIVSQAFLNIAAMTGLFPLSGLPLPFISHGGTSLLATLATLGIVLNVSKYRNHERVGVIK